VTIAAQRSGRNLHASVRDDGTGLPEGFVAGKDGLGTQIVKALVGGEMRGRIVWSSPPEGGTEVTVDVTLRGRSLDAPGTGTPAADDDADADDAGPTDVVDTDGTKDEGRDAAATAR